MEGLEKFREAFAEFTDNYVVIGGTACDIAMTGTVVRPRATHDIDMIVIAENITEAFGERLWQFVREAGYRPEKRKHIEGEPPKYELYRFLDGKVGYPEMIELLSRHPDVLGEPKGFVIEPLPLGNDTSSMSAIMMDDDFYHFTIEHSRLTDGIRHADPVALVALKAKAYLNLVADKQSGKHVNSKDIRKHRSDVLKNVVIIEDSSVEVPAPIAACINEFVDSIRDNWDELADSLAVSLGQDKEFVSELLDQLQKLFVIRP
ncbi:hypothetical protein EVA_01894 [gut metagenome]|uniref:Protein containing DUF1814 n=1 Tax=gut metagenome TaxID=749906 RepID=J9GP97_9ZZZZ